MFILIGFFSNLVENFETPKKSQALNVRFRVVLRNQFQGSETQKLGSSPGFRVFKYPTIALHF